MHMADLISHFLGKINVLYRKGTKADIIIDCLLTQADFRVVSDDCIRRLPLKDQRSDQFIQNLEIGLSDIDTRSGFCKDRSVLTVSGCSPVIVLIKATGSFLGTAVANKGCLVQKITVIGTYCEARTNPIA
jgi:hypothetical protein